jgi:hypothetical protein
MFHNRALSLAFVVVFAVIGLEFVFEFVHADPMLTAYSLRALAISIFAGAVWYFFAGEFSELATHIVGLACSVFAVSCLIMNYPTPIALTCSLAIALGLRLGYYLCQFM